ncbi:MAG TPA: hypothetical protein VHX60_00850 [Acidobacteriaceae bacterium]|jgi:hypothetical protein|nr:hypothetical protein [Acidobacteriaceae bacterium]
MMAGVGLIAKTVDKLPWWAQMVLMALGMIAIGYGVAHKGWSYFWKALFSPAW